MAYFYHILFFEYQLLDIVCYQKYYSVTIYQTQKVLDHKKIERYFCIAQIGRHTLKRSWRRCKEAVALVHPLSSFPVNCKFSIFLCSDLSRQQQFHLCFFMHNFQRFLHNMDCSNQLFSIIVNFKIYLNVLVLNRKLSTNHFDHILLLFIQHCKNLFGSSPGHVLSLFKAKWYAHVLTVPNKPELLSSIIEYYVHGVTSNYSIHEIIFKMTSHCIKNNQEILISLVLSSYNVKNRSVREW